jgi:hypothetical protein
VNLPALAILALIAAGINLAGCAQPKRDYWAGVAQGVKKNQ